MKNFVNENKSCAGFCSVIALLTLFVVVAISWGVVKFGEGSFGMWATLVVVVVVVLVAIVLYAKAHEKRFLAAVQKQRPDSLAFWASAPPNMVRPFGVSCWDIPTHAPEAVVVTASREAYEIWMNMETKAPTRSLPNTKDLKFNRGTYYLGVLITGNKEDGTYHEEDIYGEAIEIRSPNGNDLIFRTEDLGVTWEKIQELRN